MNEFLEQRLDYVITVCDQVRELCPVFPGAPQHMHWSIEDPSRVMGSEAAQREAFEQVARQLTARVQHFLAGIKRRARSPASAAQGDKDP
jgi:protein-tyrosine-phosphatase